MTQSIYLVATHYVRPKERVNTAKKGWMDNPANVQVDETMTVTKGLKKRHNAEGSIILDLLNRKVIKDNRTTKDYGQLIRYFAMNYTQQLVPVLGQVDPELLKEMADEMQANIEQEQAPHETGTDNPVDFPQSDVPVADAVEVKNEAVQAS